MAKLRRKDLEVVHARLNAMADLLIAQQSALTTIKRDLERLPLSPEVDRLEALLGGVKVALERMGGNVLPGVVQDIHALRDQMTEFRQELANYRGALMAMSRFVEGRDDAVRGVEVISKLRDYPERKPKTKPKRAYNRRKGSNEEDKPKVEISSKDAASHNEKPSGIES